jgi:GMP synthase (glutamine-hydrolysing)
VRGFVERERPVLGICYGHQMVARAIAGDDVCRRAPRPEFGWKRIEILGNPLFRGMRDPVSLQSHYDEVCGLTEEFEVIASTDDCPVQAFQLRGLPVWGVQFHPEVVYEEGERMNRDRVVKDPSLAGRIAAELDDPSRLAQNERIFRNFFRSGA